MNTTFLSFSYIFLCILEVIKEPNLSGWQARFGPYMGCLLRTTALQIAWDLCMMWETMWWHIFCCLCQTFHLLVFTGYQYIPALWIDDRDQHVHVRFLYEIYAAKSDQNQLILIGSAVSSWDTLIKKC